MNKNRKGRKMISAVCICCLAALAVLFLYWQNNDIVTTNIVLSNEKIPSAFEGFKVLHVSDLHNKNFGKNQSGLIQKVREAAPDIIVITGDLIDYHRLDVPTAMSFIRQTIPIAPVYYVPGNHEKHSGVYDQLSEQLSGAGVTVLNNQKAELSRGNQALTIAGIKDAEFEKQTKKSKPGGQFQRNLAGLLENINEFSILLSHRPEYLDLYASENADLVFCGHAHGGQIRLPSLGGLFAPGQGLLPKYTSGLYTKGNTSMIVSRGLGNSEFPFRVFNRPELILVTLKK